MGGLRDYLKLVGQEEGKERREAQDEFSQRGKQGPDSPGLGELVQDPFLNIGGQGQPRDG